MVRIASLCAEHTLSRRCQFTAVGPQARPRGGCLDGDLPLPRHGEAVVRLGHPRAGRPVTSAAPAKLDLQRAARDHLWLHFTRMGAYEDSEVPIIVSVD